MYVRFGKWDCKAKGEHYSYPRERKGIVLIGIQDGEYIATATVNLPEHYCPENEVFIKDYSENIGMVKALVKAGIIMPSPSVIVPSGHITTGRYILTTKAIEELFNDKK